MKKALTEFLKKHINKCACYYDENKICEDCERINTAPFLENEATSTDPIMDMEKYLHKIFESDYQDTMESKCDHNEALINNTQLQIIHEGLKAEIDKEKLENSNRKQSNFKTCIWFHLEQDELDMDTSENKDNAVNSL